jgi:hypothetical protein
MIRRDRMLWTMLALGLSGHAAAGTLYRCAGGPDDPVNYSSKPVAGMSCKSMSYKGQPSSRRTPVAYGYGAGANAGSMTGAGAPAAPVAPPAAGEALAGSVAIRPLPTWRQHPPALPATPVRAAVFRAWCSIPRRIPVR